MHLWIRIIGTVAVTALLTSPLWAPAWGAGLLGEILLVPFPGNLVVVGGFLALVAAYCLTLQRTLRLAGAPRPASVWWMFAIPANFVEDFYIVQRVGVAIAGAVPPGVLTGWRWLGFGWCAFQIVSLVPGVIGLLGGTVAIVLWLTHWMLTLVVNRRLR